MIRKLFFLFLCGSLTLGACSLFKKKTKTAAQTEWQSVTPFLKWTDAGTDQKVLIFPVDEPDFCLKLMEKGQKLDLVAPEKNRQALSDLYSAHIANYTFIDTKNHQLPGQMNYKAVISGATFFGRPIGLRQNQLAMVSIWQNLMKGGKWIVILNTAEAKKYGRKPSDLKTEDILDFASGHFKQYEIDSISLEAQHVIKFIK